MSNTIIELRHSSVTGNVPSSLANGEIAINTFDGKLFYRGGVSNTIQTIERFEGPDGLDTEIQFNDSGVLGASANLTFNKTTDVLSTKNIVVSNNFTANGNVSATNFLVGSLNVKDHAQAAFDAANNSATIGDILAISIALG